MSEQLGLRTLTDAAWIWGFANACYDLESFPPDVAEKELETVLAIAIEVLQEKPVEPAVAAVAAVVRRFARSTRTKLISHARVRQQRAGAITPGAN